MKAKAYRELPTHWCWRDARRAAGRENEINGMMKTGKEYGLPKPELVDFDGDFRVNMYRKVEKEVSDNSTTTQATQGTTQATQGTTQATQAELSEDDKAVLTALAEDPEITQKEIAAKLDWKIDRVKYYLNKLKRKGIIKRVGTSQNGHWEMLMIQ